MGNGSDGAKLTWSRAKLATDLDERKEPDAWDNALSIGQRFAREERIIHSKLSDAELTFNDFWTRNEIARSSEALNNWEVLQRDKGLVRERLKESNRWLLDPQSQYMEALDVLTLLALVFTVLVTPYEVGLMVKGSGTALDVINVLVNLIFVAGIVVQFFLPVRENPKKGGRLIKKHKEIARRYLRGYFFIDLVSTIPYEAIANFMNPVSEGEDDSSTAGTSTRKMLRLLRMLRAVRLLKLTRIFRSMRVVSRMTNAFERWFKINISHATRTLVFWTFATLALLHWYVCSWCLLAQAMGTQRTQELEAVRVSDGNCERGSGDCLSACEQVLLSSITGEQLELVQNGETWLCHAKARGGVSDDVTEYNHRALYWFVLGADLSGPGFVSPTSTPEYVLNFIFQFIMLIVSNIFVGVVATAQSEADPLGKAFKARMDRLNNFLDDINAPDSIRYRTREYFRCTKDLVDKQGFADLYDMFSPKLRGDVLGHISREILAVVPFFADCEPGFVRELSQKLTHAGYEHGDSVKLSEPTLCIVSRGTAVRGGKPIIANEFWGDDFIVSSSALRDNRTVVALTYMEIVCLTRKALLETMEGWPESAQCLRIVSLRQAMTRAPQVIARYLQRRARERSGKDTPRSTKVEIDAFHAGLVNIGRGADFEHREYHAVMKKINGGALLRGDASELQRSADQRLSRTAADAVKVTRGEEGKLLMDERGRIVAENGRVVDVDEDGSEDAATKAVGALRLELRADYNDLRAQLSQQGLILEELRRALGLGPGSAHPIVDAADDEERREMRLQGGQPLKAKAPSMRQKKRKPGAGPPSPEPKGGDDSGGGIGGELPDPSLSA